MRCAWCLKPVWWWQSRVPLGRGLLADSFGQFEHPRCQVTRLESMSAYANGDRANAVINRAAEIDRLQRATESQ